jgi:putative Mg2+ transporter-C (MgtC) family protein
MITWQEMTLRLLVATALGSAIGLERSRLERGAGLRTHMLVCLGSALMMIVSTFGFRDILGTGNVVLDPSRVAAQVVTGIGFIGAGTIIFHRQEVIKGLTTAAGMWVAAGIGLATGSGMYIPAVATTILALVILIVFHPVSRRMTNKFQSCEILLQMHEAVSLGNIETILQKDYGATIKQIVVEKDDKTEARRVKINLRTSNKTSFATLIGALQNISGISEVSVKE